MRKIGLLRGVEEARRRVERAVRLHHERTADRMRVVEPAAVGGALEDAVELRLTRRSRERAGSGGHLGYEVANHLSRLRRFCHGVQRLGRRFRVHCNPIGRGRVEARIGPEPDAHEERRVAVVGDQLPHRAKELVRRVDRVADLGLKVFVGVCSGGGYGAADNHALASGSETVHVVDGY